MLYSLIEFEGTLRFNGQVYYSEGQRDALVVRQSNSGGIDWVRQIGGSGDLLAHAIRVDQSGSGVFVSLSYWKDVKISGAGQSFAQGKEDALIVRFSKSGGVSWLSSIGGNGNDRLPAIWPAGADRLLAAGSFEEAISIGTAVATSDGLSDGLLLQFQGSPSAQLITRIGGQGAVDIEGIVRLSSSEIAVAGSFTLDINLEDAPGGAAPGANRVSQGGKDIFIALFKDGIGTYLQSTQYGSLGDDDAHALAIDSSDYLYPAGSFSQELFLVVPSGGAISMGLVSLGATDGFFAKLSSGTFKTNWRRQIGWEHTDSVQGARIDDIGRLWLAGQFDGTGQPSNGGTAGVYHLGNFGHADGVVSDDLSMYVSGATSADSFVAAYDASNSSGMFLWGETLGSSGGAEMAWDVAVKDCISPTTCEVLLGGQQTGTVDYGYHTLYATSTPDSYSVSLMPDAL